MLQLSLAFASYTLLLSGCGAAATSEGNTTGLHESVSRPLHALIPPGAHLVLVLDPQALLAEPSTRQVVDALLPPDERDALARRTGVEPAEIETLVLAEFEDGFVLLIRGPWQARHVVIANEIRMNTIELDESHPVERRRGYFGVDVREVVALSENVLMVATPHPTRVDEIIGSVEDADSPSALGAHADLLELHSSDPLTVFGPESPRLQDTAETGIGTLLSGQQAMAIGLEAAGERVQLTATLKGNFPDGAEENFYELVVGLAEEELGRSLGIDEALSSLTVEMPISSDGGPSMARLTLTPDAEHFARGLRILLGNDVWNFVDASSPALTDSEAQ